MKKSCPVCGHVWAWHLNDGRLKCRSCQCRYRIKSIWESFRLSEKAKRALLEKFVLGVPAYRYRFLSPASLPTVERFFRYLRAVLAHYEECREPFSGVMECDESSIGGHRRGKRGWGAAGKTIVLGILQRNGLVRVFPVPARQKRYILPLIIESTKPGSLYYTDDWHAYGALSLRGDHVVVTKKMGRPRGRNHINGIEGFWSYLKHWLYHYRGVPRKFFHLYLGEISFRFNYRHQDLYPLIYNLLRNTPITKIVKF